MRKKLLIPFLTMVFLLVMASCTLAANTLLLSPFMSGNSEIGNYDYNLSQLSLGLTVPLNTKVSVGLDLANGQISRYNYDGDTSSYRVKGSYKIYTDPKVSIDLAGSYYHRDLEIPYYADYNMSSLTLGIDGRLKFNAKAWIDLGLAFGLFPNEELQRYSGQSNEGNPNSMVLANLKYSHLLNKQLGMMAGYSYEKAASDLLEDGNSYRGIYIGGFFRF